MPDLQSENAVRLDDPLKWKGSFNYKVLAKYLAFLKVKLAEEVRRGN